MKKKLLVIFFILTLTLTACTNDSVGNQNIDQIILNNLIEDVTFESATLDENITLPSYVDGYIFEWESNDSIHLTNKGIITQPLDGEGDSTVILTLTLTSNSETLEKEFTFIIKEQSVTVVDTDTDLESDIVVLEAQIDTLEAQIDTLDVQIDTLEAQIIALEAQIAALDAGATTGTGTDTGSDYTYTGYYLGVEGLSGDILKAFLHDLIDDHTVISYGDLRQALQNSDEDPDNPDNIILLYSGASVKSTWDSAATWNREHTWPKSLGGFENDDAGSDMHHIRPTYTNVNSTRGNKFFDEGGSLVSQTDDCYSDSDSFEPRDEVKGDVARMMFYMVVRYEGNDGASGSDLELVSGGTSSNSGLLGDLDVLLQWHLDDPVDDFELERNDIIYGYQHNRNPFIDHPELVELIWN